MVRDRSGPRVTPGNATYPVEPGLDLEALERSAREALPGPVYDMIAGGAEEELTLRANVEAWSRIWLRPRVLRAVENVSTGCEVLGTHVSAPILVAPMGFHRLVHPEGEVATAAGAAASGILNVVSTRATATIEEIAAAASGAPWWFQVYILRDRAWTAELVARAVEAGCRALMFTVDVPILGRRRRDERNRFSLPPGVQMANLGEHLPVEAAQLSTYAGAEQEPVLRLEDIGWLRGLADIPVVVKGILRSDDAEACVEAGAAGVVVSNHGGRQMDGAVPTAVALPEVVDAVRDRAEVYVDGGIRGGNDVLKALAMGADAVMVGRPIFWGLALDGADGVTSLLDGLRKELERALTLCQVTSVSEIGPDTVMLPGAEGSNT